MSERGEDDPKIDGLTVRPFCWDDGPDSRLPNFSFGDVELRWHKYPGRSMTSNVQRSPAQWVEWFDAAMAAVRASEKLCGHCVEPCDGSCKSAPSDDGEVDCAF